MDRVRWDGRKWPDHPHWQFEMVRLGHDEHGVWLHAAAGTSAIRGTEPRTIPFGFVCLVTENEWWTAEFYPDHLDMNCYVNIGTPCEWVGQSVVQVDLDLDVVRRLDGSVEIIDEDEFTQHQEKYNYPNDLIDGARRAADLVLASVTESREPFAGTADRWMAIAADFRRAGGI